MTELEIVVLYRIHHLVGELYRSLLTRKMIIQSLMVHWQYTTSNVLECTMIVSYVVQYFLIIYNIPPLIKYSTISAKCKKLYGYIVRLASPSKEEEEATE